MRLPWFLAVALLPGCSSPPPATPAFDGAAAFAFVRDLVTSPDGAARHRIPGTAAHAAAADWLEATMAVHGWSVHRITFTGADYAAIDKRALEQAYPPAPRCRDPQHPVRDLRFHNLYATFDTSPPTGRRLWLAAHWDSKARASSDALDPSAPVPGANDGASGVGLLLQLMRHVAAGALAPRVDLGVVFFDGEDGFDDCHPLAGSVHFARSPGAPRVERLLLLDMVGDPDARFLQETTSLQSDPEMVARLWAHGRSYAPAAFTDVQRPMIDDHVPFAEAGIPAADLIDAARPGTGVAPWWHTTQDTLAHVDPAMLAAVGNTLWATLEDRRLTTHWPCGALPCRLQNFYERLR